jgi:tetratricopeptide (TPR) repeat protein
VDAELSPALLPDEAAALTGRRGLVFLPGGRVLAFDPAAPLPPSAWLGVTGLRRGDWRPLPEPPPLAERLTEISLDLPGDSPEDVLEAGGEGIGTEEPTPEDAGLPRRALGKAAWTAGKGLSWLGKALGLGGLARAGAHWMERALKMAPRLGEKVLGKQEASLRELLRDFQEGNIERALRRAVPLAGNDRGAVPATGSRLPDRPPRYSLKGLLGSGQGPAGIWVSSSEVYRELERHYRRLAEEAARAGDYRRAAFIYGKLLADYRAAAAALARGGLHRDAAILLLRRVGDSGAAAREFEAAGDIDRALELYRQRGEYARAGDLLRRAGEEELAVIEYQLAAEKQLVDGQGHYDAGELLRTRAGRPDLALPYYAAGWARRPAGSPVPCAVRLAQLYAEGGEAARLRTLVDEAGPYFAPPGNDSPAASFYNEVATLADRPALAAVRDDLRDRALMALAAKLRQHTGAGAAAAVSTLLGTSAAWAPAVVSDARHAVPEPARRPVVASPSPRGFTTTTIRARTARVTAVCQAPDSGDLFLGFESGEVVCYRPASGAVHRVADERSCVLSLAADEGGELVTVLGSKGPGAGTLCSYHRAVGYRLTASRAVPLEEGAWLCPLIVADSAGALLGLWAGEGFRLLRAASLLPLGSSTLREQDGPPEAGLLRPTADERDGGPGLLVLGDRCATYYGDGGMCRDGKPRARQSLGWRPRLREGSTLRQPPLAWLWAGPAELELAAPDPDGRGVHSSGVRFQEGRFVTHARWYAACPAPVLAVQLIRPGLLAALTAEEVRWLRLGSHDLTPAGAVQVSLPHAVACFPHHTGRELIVVCAEGTLARVPGLP